LTPEDVVNKRFQPTKFREGYDQDEVDDFLDEVVVELRRLNQENGELRQRLMQADQRINQLQSAPQQQMPQQQMPQQQMPPQMAPEQAARWGTQRQARTRSARTPAVPTICCNLHARCTSSTFAKESRSATPHRRGPSAGRTRCSRGRNAATLCEQCSRGRASATRKPRRRASQLRARLPSQAQGLH